MKPLIGITPSVDGAFYKINSAYCNAIALAGGIPIILPYNRPEVSMLCPQLHGLLLSGGGDIHSHYFRQELHPEASDISLPRDAFEISICDMALGLDMPILGICRGIQILNSTIGGDILQDINNHSHPNEREKPVHSVSIKPGSLLHSIMGSASTRVNSIHHQAVYRLGEGLQASAMSPEGIIEAIEHTHKRFVMGVQWHPECLFEEYPIHFTLFKSFIQAAGA